MSGYNVSRYTIESRKVHKSEQRGHLKIKYRRDNKEDFKEHISERGKESELKEQKCLRNHEDITKEPSEIESNGQSDDSENEILLVNDHNDDSNDELDEDEELLLELEKIRRERKNKEKEKKNNEIMLMMKNNPLLDLPQDHKGTMVDKNGPNSDEKEEYDEYILKRSWLDDTVFKNQHKYKEKKRRFINDTLHNDFHKEFMKKYII